MSAVPIRTALPFDPTQVKHRHCCFCIPARAAVLITAMVAATVSAMHGIQACIRLFEPEHFNGLVVWLDVAQIVLWFSLVVVCLNGFSGAMMKKFIWVDWFYDLVWVSLPIGSQSKQRLISSLQWHLWINVIVGIYLLTWLHLPSSREFVIGLCLKGVTIATSTALNRQEDDLDSALEALAIAAKACTSHTQYSLLLLDFCWTLAILVELYLVMVVAHYLDELADLEAAQNYQVEIESATPPFRFAETEQDPLFQVKRSSRF
ncbi:hypothetical protein JCM11251_003068 [Rhodosporidiobolus azoricus]